MPLPFVIFYQVPAGWDQVEEQMGNSEGLLCPLRTTTDTEVSVTILSCILSVFSGSVDQQRREEPRGHNLESSSPDLRAASTVKLFGHSVLVCLGASHS